MLPEATFFQELVQQDHGVGFKLKPEPRAAILVTLPSFRRRSDDEIIRLVENSLAIWDYNLNQPDQWLRKSSKSDIEALADCCSKIAAKVEKLGADRIAFLEWWLGDGDISRIESDLRYGVDVLLRFAKTVEHAGPDRVAQALLHGNRDNATDIFLQCLAATWILSVGDPPQIYSNDNGAGGEALAFFRVVAKQVKPLPDSTFISFVSKQKRTR
jgi:hypothetical protein